MYYPGWTNPPQELLSHQRAQLKDDEVQHTTYIPSKYRSRLSTFTNKINIILKLVACICYFQESDDKHRHDKFQGFVSACHGTNCRCVLFVDRHQDALCGDGTWTCCHSASWLPWIMVYLEIPGISIVQLIKYST